MSKKFKKRNLQSLLFILLTVLAVYILLRSSIFSIKTIEINGLNLLSEDDILSNVTFCQGDNIFQPNLKEEEMLLLALPMIKEAGISRDFPSGIQIDLIERVPLALLVTHNKCVQVDAEGVYLGTGSYGDLGLPLINNQEITLGKPGEKIQGKNLDKILTGVAQIPSELREKISEVNYTDEEGFVFYTLDGIQCRMGFPEDMSQKGQSLLDILSNLQSQGYKVVYINMSYVGNPVVKYEE